MAQVPSLFGAGANTTLEPISLILNHFLKSPPAFCRRRFQHLSDTQSLKCHLFPSQSHTIIILRHPISSHCTFLIQFLPPPGAGVDLFGAGLNTNGAGALTFGAGLNTNGAGAFLRGVPAPQNAILRSTVAQAPAKKSHLHQIAKHLRQTNQQNLTTSRESNLVRTIRREPRSNAKRASRVCPFRHGHRREPCTCRLLRAKPFRCKV